MRQRLMFRLALAACVGLYVAHFAVVMSEAVNLPFWDEWEVLNPEQLPAGLSFNWLYQQHNEHRITTTKFLTWTLYQLNGWNHVTHQAINFLLYGLLLVVIVRIARFTAPWLETWVVLSFTIFLLSPIDYENHFWGFQSTFRFSLLFFFSSVYFLYQERQRRLQLMLGSTMAVLAMYSASNGLVASVVSVALFGLFKLTRFNAAVTTVERSRELRQAFTVIAIVGAALTAWFADFERVGNHPPHVLPHNEQFWRYFAGITGLGFGLDVTAFLPNLLCLLIVTVPIVFQVLRTKGRLPTASWALYAAAAGVLATLAAITIGRASFGIEQAKASRYSEIAMTLIPLSALTWSVLLRHRARLRHAVLIALWAFCFVTFFNNWSSFAIYEAHGDQRRLGLRCIERYYEGSGAANCPTVYPGLLTGKLNYARALNASFYQQLLPQIGPARRNAGPISMYSIDAINGRPVPLDAPIVVDASVHPQITVGGWAVDPDAGVEAEGVLVSIDDTIDIEMEYGSARPDVADHFGVPRYGMSGFNGIIPVSVLTKGRHSLALKVLASDQARYYESDRRVEIEVR